MIKTWSTLPHTGTVFQNEPDETLRYYNLVKPGDMGMKELPVVMYFAGEVCIFSVRGFQNHLSVTSDRSLNFNMAFSNHL